MRIGFFGTPSLSSCVLHDLLAASDIEVMFVVTNPDTSIGRSGELRPTPVKLLAVSHNIPVYTPSRIRANNELFTELKAYNCDYFIVVAYGRILPVELLDIPLKMCINIHGSILPAYRGASPIQAALLNGNRETGVTIMEMSEGMDEGDILKIRLIEIDTAETSTTLFAKFAEVSGPILIQTIRELEMGGITPLPQDASQATYCKKIEKEDGRINWTDTALSIYHRWQAYTPWPGIYTMYEGKRLLLETISRFPDFEAQDHSTEGSDTSSTGLQKIQTPQHIGMVIALEGGEIGIICGKGILTLQRVKLEGKKSQNIKDFLNGNQKFIGYNFL